MDVYLLDEIKMLALAQNSNSDKFNLAVNELTASMYNDGSKDKTSFAVYVQQADNGQFGVTGTSYIQPISTSTPVRSVAPSFFPVATAGAECGAEVKNLSWADSNLLTGYDSVLLNPSSNAASQRWFVTGILNSSQTQANDPFSSTTYPDLVGACCWAGNFVSGVNPFD